ncbi:UNVERIFIED_CONTAM: Aspartic proteinase CDR1 [Sesamum radiatum]|uniref:Aspartic proteinase CDR1 n=1 Tax=Sesamum radiatum TaxID=300843 RepID=A0AAW2KPF5_SESRA
MVRTMKVDPIVTACTSLIFAISMTRRFHLSEAQGFSIDLLHRDFLQSPSLVSSSMSSERVTNALRQSFNRVNVLTQDYARLPSTDIFPDKGEYLMKLSIGTLPFETLAIADTGSDLTWIRCNRPSSLCLHPKAPLFEPTHSSTYKPISCTSSPCNSLLGCAFCDGFKGICRYTAEYGDGSFSNGDLATETMKLGTVTIPNVTIGCGYHDKSSFGASASGIAGLRGGKASLITKMGPLIRGKFSYCLVPHLSEMSKTSKMSFGDHAAVSGHNVVTTPIVARTPNTFYFLTLEAITIGNKRIDLYSPSTFSQRNGTEPLGEGNIIIDSGTTLTFLPRELYNKVIAEVKSQMKLREIDDPQGLLSLCYLSIENAAQVPEIIVHFKGADLKLKYVNMFVKTSKSALCLAFAPASSVAIYGNLAQMEFLVGYDLEKRTVSFKPTDCSKT